MAAPKTKRNPSYEIMAIQAVTAVTSQNNQRSCSSQAIKTFLSQNFSIELTSTTGGYLKRGLERALDNNKLVRLTGVGLSGSFRLPIKKKHSLVRNAPHGRTTTTKRVQKAQPEPEALNSKNLLPPPALAPAPPNKTTKTAKSAPVARVGRALRPRRRMMFCHSNVRTNKTKTPSTSFDQLSISVADEVSFSILMTSDAGSQDGEISTISDSETLTSGQEDTIIFNSETSRATNFVKSHDHSDSDEELWDDLEEESD